MTDAQTNHLTFALPSPCVGVCEMDEARRYCKGCLRTIPEIKIWSTASEAQKWDILQQLKTRRHDRDGIQPRRDRVKRRG
ncbi:MAG: DUF1289 domain-containing protein [Hydrotalea sp.]|nr:DUF1289 domain-containing protein [Hydrotalea sp.]